MWHWQGRLAWGGFPGMLSHSAVGLFGNVLGDT